MLISQFENLLVDVGLCYPGPPLGAVLCYLGPPLGLSTPSLQLPGMLGLMAINWVVPQKVRSAEDSSLTQGHNPSLGTANLWWLINAGLQSLTTLPSVGANLKGHLSSRAPCKICPAGHFFPLSTSPFFISLQILFLWTHSNKHLHANKCLPLCLLPGGTQRKTLYQE